MLTDLPWKTILTIVVVAASGGVGVSWVAFWGRWWNVGLFVLTILGTILVAVLGSEPIQPFIGYSVEFICGVISLYLGFELGEWLERCWRERSKESIFPLWS